MDIRCEPSIVADSVSSSTVGALGAGVALASCLGALLGGCNSLWGIDELQFGGAGPATPGSGGTGGAGATGGSAASSSSTTSSSSGTTTATTGTTGTTSTTGTSDGGAGPFELVILAEPGLEGDGFLADPPRCGHDIIDFQTSGQDRVVVVGRERACDDTSTLRAFFRFDLASYHALPAEAQLLSVTLQLYLHERWWTASPAILWSIDDFGELAWSDWDAATRDSFGVFVDPESMPGWVSRDVVIAVLEAVGESHVAFELRYSDEAEIPTNDLATYELRSSDGSSDFAPRIVVGYDLP
jgi:hypothetical protein